MKKNSERIFLYSAVFFALALISCNTVEDEEITKKPNITINSASISLSVAANDKADYINILRKEDGSTDVMNVGEIIPSSSDKSDSYIFEDKLIKTGTKYDYRLRYKINGSYQYSNWSEWPVDSTDTDIPAPTTVFASDDDLKPAVGSATLTFDDSTELLLLTGGDIPCDANMTDFDLCIVLDNGQKSRTFFVSEYAATPANYLEAGPTGYIILKDILPADFLNVELKVKGFILEYKDPVSRTYDLIQWSQLAEITVNDSTSTPLETIKITSIETKDNEHDF